MKRLSLQWRITLMDICDFSRDGLNARLCTGIQTLLRGHKYRASFFFEGCVFLNELNNKFPFIGNSSF